MLGSPFHSPPSFHIKYHKEIGTTIVVHTKAVVVFSKKCDSMWPMSIRMCID